MAKPKNKFYAIKKGKDGIRGIFEKPWSEVAPMVQGVQNASYKGFPTENEAMNWFYDMEREVIEIEQDENTLVAYVDGSSSATIEEYGSGVVLIFPDGQIEELSFSGNHEDAKTMKNVAGELSGAMRAMQMAKKKKFKKLIICYDYQGIEKWLTNEWKCKNEMTKLYKQWYDKNIKDYLEVGFKWVKGHSGDKYNDLADSLAKKAIGVGV